MKNIVSGVLPIVFLIIMAERANGKIESQRRKLRVIETGNCMNGLLKNYAVWPSNKIELQFSESNGKTILKPGYNLEEMVLGNKPNKLIVAVLLLCVAGLAFCFYKQKKGDTEYIIKLKTELTEKTICLDNSSEEREWLVKEIHHRVKNNLQIVTSLLNTQLAYLTDRDAIKAIRESQHRIFAISLVHQLLYQADDLSDIDMIVYTHELLEYLGDSFECGQRIELQVEMVPLSLNISMAVPFGLIINEAVTNSLKYAFPAKSGGKVSVSLKSVDQKAYALRIADDGVGLDDNKGRYVSDSLGKNLMEGLARQLGGKYEINNNHGVEINITFSKKPVNETIDA